MQTRLLINGKLVAGEGKVEQVLNPATGKVLAKVPEASRAQIDAAVKAADAAFEGWSRTPPKDRAALLLKLADRIEADGPAFAKLESLNCGKPLPAALNDEIPADRRRVPLLRRRLPQMTGAVAGEYLPGFTSMIRRDPIGVVASIAPWNYPLMMAAWKLGPALAAGNTVRAQAVRADAAHGAAARRAAGGDPAGRRRERRLRARRHRSARRSRSTRRCA